MSGGALRAYPLANRVCFGRYYNGMTKSQHIIAAIRMSKTPPTKKEIWAVVKDFSGIATKKECGSLLKILRRERRVSARRNPNERHRKEGYIYSVIGHKDTKIVLPSRDDFVKFPKPVLSFAPGRLVAEHTIAVIKETKKSKKKKEEKQDKSDAVEAEQLD